MKKSGIVALFAVASLLQACATTPQQQRQNECLAATTGGAVLGAALGNQLGGGTGKDILTAGGAVAGAQAAKNVSQC